MKARYTEEEYKTLHVELQKELKQGEDKLWYPIIEEADGWAFENVHGLRETMRTERQRREEWERKHTDLTRTLGSVQPDDIKGLPDLKRKLKDMESWAPEEKVQARITAIEGEYRQKLADAEKLKNDEVGSLENELNQLLVVDHARAKLEKLRATDPDLLLPHVKARTRVVRDPATKRRQVVVVDEHGDPLATKKPGAVGNMQLDELLEGYRKTWPTAFKAPETSGGGAGAPGAGGSGDSSSGHPNAGDASKLPPEQRLVALRRSGAASQT